MLKAVKTLDFKLYEFMIKNHKSIDEITEDLCSIDFYYLTEDEDTLLTEAGADASQASASDPAGNASTNTSSNAGANALNTGTMNNGQPMDTNAQPFDAKSGDLNMDSPENNLKNSDGSGDMSSSMGGFGGAPETAGELGDENNADFGKDSEQIMKEKNTFVNNIKQVIKLKDILDDLSNQTKDKEFSKISFNIQKIINAIADEGEALLNREDLADINKSMGDSLKSLFRYVSNRLKNKYNAEPPKDLFEKIKEYDKEEEPDIDENGIDNTFGDTEGGETSNEAVYGSNDSKDASLADLGNFDFGI